MLEVLKRLVGMSADPSDKPAGSIGWPDVRKSIRDALIVAAACGGIFLLDQLSGVDWSGTRWEWVGQAVAASGALALLRRWLVDQSEAVKQ